MQLQAPSIVHVITTGCVSSVIMSGPVLVVTILFSKSREFDRASSTGPMCCGAPTQQDTGKNPKSPKNPTASALKYDTGKRHASALSLFLPEDNIEHNAKESEEPSVNNPRDQKKPFALPSWCRYIGWFVSLAASLWITYYILLLSFKWGVGISQMWLLSVLVSVFTSTIISDPGYVLGLALVATYFAQDIGKALFQKTTGSVGMAYAHDAEIPPPPESILAMAMRLLPCCPAPIDYEDVYITECGNKPQFIGNYRKYGNLPVLCTPCHLMGVLMTTSIWPAST